MKKVGAFRAERTVKVVPLELIKLGKKRVHSEKVGAFRANRTEKVGAFRANKTQKGGLYRGFHMVDPPPPAPRDQNKFTQGPYIGSLVY